MGRGKAILEKAKRDSAFAEGLGLLPGESGTAAPPAAEREKKPAEKEWEQPIPLQEYKVPPFPVSIFPGWLQEYVKAEAEATQTPADLAGMLALAVLATAAQKKFNVVIRPGWVEPLNLWPLVAMPPASRKSVVFGDMMKTIFQYEKAKTEGLADTITNKQAEWDILEQSFQHLKARAAKSTDRQEREELTRGAQEVGRELAEIDVPAFPQLVADDITPEGAIKLMAEQGGKLSILSPEGGIFGILAGRYSGNVNIENFLKAHAGDDVRVNRTNRKPDHIHKPALTLGLAVQPDVLKGIADIPGFRGRGFLARFLYALPGSMVGYRRTNPPPVPETIAKQYRGNVKKLLSLSPGTDEGGKPAAHSLTLSLAAGEQFKDFLEWLEPELKPGATLGDLTDWGGKLAGAVARIAGLLHLAENLNDSAPWGVPIGATVMENAIRLGRDYLIPQAKAAFAEMGVDADIENAKYVWTVIQAKGGREFKKQDVWQWTRGRFKKVEPLNMALAILVERKYLNEVIPEHKGPGRKPAPSYKINPHTYAYNTYNTYNTPNNINSRDSRDSRDEDMKTKRVIL